MSTEKTLFPFEGPYVIELSSGAARDILPKAAFVDGEFVTVVSGRVAHTGDGFLFTVDDSVAGPQRTGGEFTYSHDQIKAIWSHASGRQLWPTPK